MKSARRLSLTPGTALGFIALFFALGGSAFAVGERIQARSSPSRAANGAVRGSASGDEQEWRTSRTSYELRGAFRGFNCTVRRSRCDA
jgi:hypothetical protein